jgi:hypothetical protein
VNSLLTISSSQIAQLEEIALVQFQADMVRHLVEFSPQLCATLDVRQLRIAVNRGINKAHGYGFTHRGPVRLYLELVSIFGSQFDTDPQYPWAAQILRDESTPQMLRAERLYDETLGFHSKVIGSQGVHGINALKRTSTYFFENGKFDTQGFGRQMVAQIESLYPQKAQYLGRSGMESLIRSGVGVGRQFSTLPLHASALMTVLMLSFGHGCATDPLYPWIERTLADQMIVDDAARLQRLEGKARTWLAQVLQSIEGIS